MTTQSWTVRALPTEVRPLRDEVAQFVAARGVDSDAMQDLRLALSEAVSNVVRHAYVGTDPGLLTVEVDVLPSELRVVVRDHGGGLRPRPDSPGAGLGLPLMASLATRFEVGERPEGGTEVRMGFARRQSVAA